MSRILLTAKSVLLLQLFEDVQILLVGGVAVLIKHVQVLSLDQVCRVDPC
jgi:hypothetical protein